MTDDKQVEGMAPPEQVLPPDKGVVLEASEQVTEPPSPAAAEPNVGVPDKQIHRWKDDGGAVIFD